MQNTVNFRFHCELCNGKGQLWTPHFKFNHNPSFKKDFGQGMFAKALVCTIWVVVLLCSVRQVHPGSHLGYYWSSPLWLTHWHWLLAVVESVSLVPYGLAPLIPRCLVRGPSLICVSAGSKSTFPTHFLCCLAQYPIYCPVTKGTYLYPMGTSICNLEL
jgi:hypothetical protein